MTPLETLAMKEEKLKTWKNLQIQLNIPKNGFSTISYKILRCLEKIFKGSGHNLSTHNMATGTKFFIKILNFSIKSHSL